MRISSLAIRTKKFFSKKRRSAKFELGQIHADGLSRAHVESVARGFQAKAIKQEAKAAFHKSREKRLKNYLFNSRAGRSDSNHKSLPPLTTTVSLGKEVSIERDTFNYNHAQAKDAREKAVMRRLYSQRVLKKQNKK